MSAFGGKADIGPTFRDVCFWPKADLRAHRLLLRKFAICRRGGGMTRERGCLLAVGHHFVRF